MVIAGPEAFAFKWGQNVKKLREINGLSRTVFAAKLGTTEATISRWESGKVTPSDHHKIRIAGLLNVDPNTIFPLPAIPFEGVAA